MTVEELLKHGATISLSYKKGVKDWYREMKLGFIDNQPFWQGLPNSNEYRKNLNYEESMYLFMSVYKHWENLAYVSERINKDELDFEYLSPEDKVLISNEKKLIKKEWEKEFDIDRLNSFKKTTSPNPTVDILTILDDKDIEKYFDILLNYKNEKENLGNETSIYIHHENISSLVNINDNEWDKKKFDHLIKDETFKIEGLIISLNIDNKNYSIKL